MTRFTFSMSSSIFLNIIKQNNNSLNDLQDLPLKLARKCVDVFGASTVDPSSSSAAAGAHHTVDFSGCGDGGGEEAADLRAGADFALMVSAQGKLFYTGKSSAIGHKQPCPPGRWNEVAVSRSPKIAQGPDSIAQLKFQLNL